MRKGQNFIRVDPNDIIDRKFGKLTVIQYQGVNSKKHRYRCHCDCGKESIVIRESLIHGRTKSCGRCNEPTIEKEGDHYRYNCTNGRFFIFDECDLPLLQRIRCTVSDRGYASAFRKKVLVDHLILKVDSGVVVDHINGNPIDNRRCNLRIAGSFENNWNAKINNRNSTGYKGVYPDNKTGKFHARICENSRRHYLGAYLLPEEAAKAYDTAARKYFGEFAALNFPVEGEQNCNRRPLTLKE